MAPETHIRYRVQRLIRLGEWLEKNQDAMVALFDQIDDAHDWLVDGPEGMSDSEIIDHVGFKQLQAIKGMNRMMSELRHHIPTKHVRRGVDVTIHQPFALKNEWQVVIEAPEAKVPSQTEYDAMSAEERKKLSEDQAALYERCKKD